MKIALYTTAKHQKATAEQFDAIKQSITEFVNDRYPYASFRIVEKEHPQATYNAKIASRSLYPFEMALVSVESYSWSEENSVSHTIKNELVDIADLIAE